MRLLHTSDWHLGHALRDISREHEHAAFLRWLLEVVEREAPDAIVITGDVFDSATPPASAERMWFEFLASARRARPGMDIVAIAGNHDSPARLGAASSVLRELGVHVVGHLVDDCLIEVAGGRGLVAAVPFLRPVDVSIDTEDPLAAVYGDVIARARARRKAGQALIVTGHLYVTGAEPGASERRVSIGGSEAASPKLFPDDIDYVALGHLHRAQRVWRDSVRYAGAPLPLALDEARYRHSIAIVDFGERASVRTLEIPRAIEFAKLAGSLEEVVAAIAMLPPRGDGMPPYLEIVVALTRPEPRLRQVIEAALDGKHARLVQLRADVSGDGAALADKVTARLAELDPREVFARLWSRTHAEPPSAAVIGAFERLLADVRGDVADPEAA